MPASFVRAATTTPYSGTGNQMTCVFASNNLASFLVLGVCQQVGTSTDTCTVSDSAGNTWLQALAPVNPGSDQQVSIWYVPSCLPSNENVVTVEFTGTTGATSVAIGMEYGGIVNPTVNGTYELAYQPEIGTAQYLSGTPAVFLYTSFAVPRPSDQGGADTNVVNGESLTARVYGSYYCGADIVAPGPPHTGPGGSYVAEYTTANSAFGTVFAIAFNYTQPSSPTGGTPVGTFGRNIIAGPEYRFECLPHGRKMAQITIDTTVLPQVNSAANFPEFSNVSNPGDIAGYVEVNFDLTNISNQMGLEECRTVLVYARPLYGYTNGSASQDDFQAPADVACPALLTSLATRQTIVLGGYAASQGRQAPFESAGYAFPVHGKTMPCRFLAPQRVNGSNFGKYTLLFCNWDAGTPGAATGFFSQSSGGGSSGPAGGDLSGTYPDPTVAAVHATSGTLNGVTIGTANPSPQIDANFIKIVGPTSGPAVHIFECYGESGSLVGYFANDGTFYATSNIIGANVILGNNLSCQFLQGITNAPTGVGPTGFWALSQDGKISFCKAGVWEVVASAP